jgi:hypothetical protein
MSRSIANRNRNEPTLFVRALPDGFALLILVSLHKASGMAKVD